MSSIFNVRVQIVREILQARCEDLSRAPKLASQKTHKKPQILAAIKCLAKF